MDDLFSLEVREAPYFMAKGKLKFNAIGTNLSQSLSSLIESDRRVSDAYKKYINDHRLLGQDKADILEDITDMIISVVTLRLYISQKVFNQNIVEALHKDRGFEIKIFLTNYEFMLNGFFSTNLLSKISTFHYWDEKYFIPLYEKLLRTFKMAISDGKISEGEGKEIAEILDDMLHLLILIYFKLESAYIES